MIIEVIDWNHKATVLQRVKKNGSALYYASKRLKDDREVVLAAVKKNVVALKFASERLRDNEEIVREALKRNVYLHSSA